MIFSYRFFPPHPQIQNDLETVKNPDSKRLIENVHMQGFGNWGPACRVWSPNEARTNPEE